jgi:hypothetical protein
MKEESRNVLSETRRLEFRRVRTACAYLPVLSVAHGLGACGSSSIRAGGNAARAVRCWTGMFAAVPWEKCDHMGDVWHAVCGT